MQKALILAIAAAASLGGAFPAAAHPGSQPHAHAAGAEPEVRVPFLHLGRARSFRAVDERTVYVHVRRNEWYRLTTFATCINLPWAHHIGVDTHGGALDRTSILLVDGQRCALESVVRSGEPPKRQRRPRSRS